MVFGLLKYILFFINILLFSQTELESSSKMLVLSCSKLISYKFQEKPSPEILSKMMLSCFIKISNNQAQKILNSEKKDSFPLELTEIEELININNLNQFSEEELKLKSDLMNKLIKETDNHNNNLRKLVEIDDNDNNEDKQNKDNKDDTVIKDDDDDNDNDDDNDINDDGDDPNYYGDDGFDDENMYNDYDDYYDDYYNDEYWNNSNYDYGNMSDDDYDYSRMYDNDYGYNYNENKSYKEMIMENKFAVIFVVFLIIFITLVAIFGKDYEETQTLEIDPNKNKHE